MQRFSLLFTWLFMPRLQDIETKAAALVSAHGVDVLRIALAVVFIWFGALKVFGMSPVYDLVSAAVPWVSPEFFVPALGVWEMAIGIGLLTARALRVTLTLFFLQMAGTFLVLFVRPDIVFLHGNPIMLTTEGEFVIKNFVFISAGAVVGSALHARKKLARETVIVEQG